MSDDDKFILRYLCRIHGIKFGTSPEVPGLSCPECSRERANKALRDLAKVTEERDALKRAIEIKLDITKEEIRES